MCGIAGIMHLNKEIKLNVQSDVLVSLKHRGPDAQRYFSFDNAVFYHTRLSIIDLTEHSHQPFLWNNKCLVFNGEIFNYQTLAKSLNIPNAKSDTEVLIQYFDKYKIEGLHHLNGFFAFAFYDNEQQELYLVRDRYGEKPLYYYYDENILAFASEIYPLLQLIDKKFSINEDVLYTYFRLHYIAGENSIFKGIKRLLPGHYIHIKQNQIKFNKWYSLEEQSNNSSESFDKLFADAVQMRLVSDAPIGAFLSGGIDSSIVCAIAKQFKSNLHTFSLGYAGEELYNETSDAFQIAQHIGSIHHNFEITYEEVQSKMNDILNAIDEPFADSSAINVYFLSQKIKPYATVALSGDGSDELLMGYNKHKVFLLRYYPILKLLAILTQPILSIFPDNRSHKFFNDIRKLKKFVRASQLSPLKKYIYLSQWAEDNYIHRLFSPSLNNHYFYQLFEKYQNLDEVKLFNLADIEMVLANDMLYKIDFLGMQNAVEIRSPFLDHRIVEYLYHTHFENKIYYSQQKYLLKRHFKDKLPSFVFQKKKRGFEIPLHKILPNIIDKNPFLTEEFIREQKLFNYSVIQELKTQLNTNINDAALKLWTILVFQHWHNKFQKYIAH